MYPDFQILLINMPERLKQHFCLSARIHKNQAGLVVLNMLIDDIQRIKRIMPSPWHIIALR